MDTRTYSIDGDGTYRSGTNRISLQNTDITMSPIITFTLKQVRSEGMRMYTSISLTIGILWISTYGTLILRYSMPCALSMRVCYVCSQSSHSGRTTLI